MQRALIGTLLLAGLVIGCSKDKSEEQPAAVKAAATKAKKKPAKKPKVAEPEPEPENTCTFAQGEHASPPSFTLQNGLKVEGKVYAGTADATIDKAAPTNNAGTDKEIVPKGGKKARHGLVRWDLSAVPASTVIKGACMALFIEDPSAQSYKVSELLRNWSESEVTWTSATKEAAWAMPGAWGGTDSGAEATTILAKAPGVQTVALPTSLVQKWIAEKGANHGLIIANDRSFDGLTISSASSETATQRPALLIWK